MEATLNLKSFLKGFSEVDCNLETFRVDCQSPSSVYSHMKSLPDHSFDLSLPSPSTRHRMSAMRSSMTSFTSIDQSLNIPKIVIASHNLSISLPTSPRLHITRTKTETQVTYFNKRPVALNILLDNYPSSRRLF